MRESGLSVHHRCGCNLSASSIDAAMLIRLTLPPAKTKLKIGNRSSETTWCAGLEPHERLLWYLFAAHFPEPPCANSREEIAFPAQSSASFPTCPAHLRSWWASPQRRRWLNIQARRCPGHAVMDLLPRLASGPESAYIEESNHVNAQSLRNQADARTDRRIVARAQSGRAFWHLCWSTTAL